MITSVSEKQTCEIEIEEDGMNASLSSVRLPVYNGRSVVIVCPYDLFYALLPALVSTFFLSIATESTQTAYAE